MLITILGLIGSILPSLLQGFGVSASIDNLIPALLTAITGIITSIKTKAPVTSELAVLQTALTALQADKSLSPVILGDISEGVADLQAAITAYQAGQTKTDPSTLTPLPSLA
jgi:tetrahydromethanopterin S-methyltransferase subunit C